MDTSKKSTKDDQGETEIKPIDKMRTSASSDKVINVIKESNKKLLNQIQSHHDAKMTRMDKFLNIFEKSVEGAKKD